jgi:hypothetical protein
MSDVVAKPADSSASESGTGRRFWQIHLNTAVIALLLASSLYGLDLVILLDNGMVEPWEVLQPGEWLFLIGAETAMIVGVSIVVERAARRAEGDRECLNYLQIILQRGLLRPEDILTISSSGICINDQVLSGVFPADVIGSFFQYVAQNGTCVDGVVIYKYSVERYAEVQPDRDVDGAIIKLTFRQHFTSPPRTDAPSQT